MMKFDTRFFHEINSLFSKTTTSLQILKEDLSKEEKEEVITILENSLNRLSTVCFLILSEKRSVNLENVDISKLIPLNKNLVFYTDKKIFYKIINIFKNMSKTEINLSVDNNKLVISQLSLKEDPLNYYIFKLIENVLNMIHIKITVSKKYIILEQKNENPDH